MARVQYSPKGRRFNVYSDKEDIHFSEKLVKPLGDEEPIRRPRSEELETYVERLESQETDVGYVTRDNYHDTQPIAYVLKEQVEDKKSFIRISKATSVSPRRSLSGENTLRNTTAA